MTNGPARVDFGYSWFWTYGHLLPAAALTTAATASAQTGGPESVVVSVIRGFGSRGRVN